MCPEVYGGDIIESHVNDWSIRYQFTSLLYARNASLLCKTQRQNKSILYQVKFLQKPSRKSCTVLFQNVALGLGVQRYTRPRYDTYRDTEVTMRYDTIQNDIHTHHEVFNVSTISIFHDDYAVIYKVGLQRYA
jgi:hypothetical protein